MALLINLCLVLMGLAGVGAAVGIPIALNVKSKNNAITSRESSGGGTEMASVELTECQSGSQTSVSTVEFGAQVTDKVCWKIQDGSANLSNKVEYTKLFQSIWGSSSRNWSEVSAGDWKTECSKSDASWEIWSSGATDEGRNEKDEYLGLCDNTSNTGNNLFVKKREENNNRTILVCTGVDNCWSLGELRDVDSSNSKKKLESDNSSNWKTVTFQKSN